MVLKFYPSKDATIYERYPTKNTGLDAGLELSKTFVGTASYNSRILIDFDYVAISRSIVEMGLNPNTFDWKLKLYATQVDEVPNDYTLYCYPISQSWAMGVGKIGHNPISTEGVSWEFRSGASLTSSAWSTGSYNANSTGSWTNQAGGGTWFTSSVVSQSFNYSEADLNLDFNPIIRGIQSGSFTFTGVIIKKSDQDEQSASIFSSIKFFSKDTSTIFMPVIEACYDDSAFTGSLSFIDTRSEFNVVTTNLAPKYSQLSTPTIRFAARPRYPVHSFSTSSMYITRQILSGSQYAVCNAHSDDVIIEFSDYTKISHDEVGNYFKLQMSSFHPERFYRIKLRVPNSGSYGYTTLDEDWLFKVIRE